VSARRRILGLTALLSTSALACPAAAQQATRAQVEHDLAGFEQGADDATVRAWGADAPALLMTIGNDPNEPAHVRQRAVFALRHFAQRPAVRDYLRALAAVPEQGLYVLRAALDALVMGGGDVATAAGFLDDPRVDVRDGAAWALARTSNPAARVALSARLRVERDETVRRTISDALAAATRTTH
jgi:HEAT repeat protein